MCPILNLQWCKMLYAFRKSMAKWRGRLRRPRDFVSLVIDGFEFHSLGTRETKSPVPRRGTCHFAMLFLKALS